LAAVALGGVALFARARLRRAAHLIDRAHHLAWAQGRIEELKPEVVLYFAGTAEAAYQVNVWLSTLEQLELRPLILLRHSAVLKKIGETTVPVLCLPRATDVMEMELADLRVALYPANSGQNSHLLRLASVRHVFVGHGDSDKIPSFNPFTRVYDEVWVAGRAGRDRYAVAGVGVRDENIVEVGRPQLDGIRPGPTGNAKPVVLYAPTWEGWNAEMNESSVAVLGERLAGALLSDEVVFVYKPHPLTGTRLPEVAAAHRRLVGMIKAAGGPHRVVSGGSLQDCFNGCDLLVSDVSSVISDFVAARKPYAVTNLRGLDAEEFRRAYPTASAGYLLDPTCAALPALLAAARGADPLAAERDRLREYLLGPDEPRPIVRFNDALLMLAKR
ncbi:CDP-glycerol glycerophosphotransferase family protein, partial [Actinocorallia lasiicapitis]